MDRTAVFQSLGLQPNTSCTKTVWLESRFTRYQQHRTALSLCFHFLKLVPLLPIFSLLPILLLQNYSLSCTFPIFFSFILSYYLLFSFPLLSTSFVKPWCMWLGCARLLANSNERKPCERFSGSFQDPAHKFQNAASSTPHLENHLETLPQFSVLHSHTVSVL